MTSWIYKATHSTNIKWSIAETDTRIKIKKLSNLFRIKNDVIPQ